jgi:hypothetical protein
MKKLIPALKRIVAEDNKFHIELKDIDFYDDAFIKELEVNPEDVRFEYVNFTWQYDMVVKDYGIKSLSAIVPDQTITVSGTSDHVPFTKEIAISDVDVEYLIPEDDTVGDLGLFPVAIEVSRGKWTVKFQTAGA